MGGLRASLPSYSIKLNATLRLVQKKGTIMKRRSSLRVIICLQLAALMAFAAIPVAAFASTTNADAAPILSTAASAKRIKKRTYTTKNFKITVPKKWKGKWYKESVRKSGGVTTYTFSKNARYGSYSYREYGTVYVCNSKKAAKRACSYAKYVGKSRRGKYVYIYTDTSFFKIYNNSGSSSSYARVRVR